MWYGTISHHTTYSEKASCRCLRGAFLLEGYFHIRPSKNRPAAEAERWPKWGCCNRRLLGLENAVAKIYFRAPYFLKTIICVSRQQPHADRSPEAQQAERFCSGVRKKERPKTSPFFVPPSRIELLSKV